MEIIDLPLDEKELTYYLYGGHTEYEKFVTTKSLKNKFDFLKFKPENYAHESPQHLAEEGSTVLELIRLHKSKKLNLKTHLQYLKDITPYSRTIETHFNLFKNTIITFTSSKNIQTVQKLIDSVSVLGSLLFQEFDFTRNVVEDKIETIATFNSSSGKILLNTPSDRAKFCRFYTPHSTHVLVFARIKTSPEADLTAPHPFLIPLRDPKTLELLPGITMKWFGPSFGGVSGREYAYQFKDFAIDPEKILLDKYLTFSNKNLEVKGNDMVISFAKKLCFLLEQDQAVEKSIREAFKVLFLVVRHSNNRTQFQTLDEKGKERPIFDYNYNKTRIMKCLVEMMNLQSVHLIMRRGIFMSIGNPEKNFQRLSDLCIFYDMFEAHVNERCLIVIESLRESIGGIGYLKYSGVPTLQENAMRNAVFTGPVKELRYLKFAQFFANEDLKNPGQFIAHFTSGLTEDFKGFEVKEGFNHNASFYSFLLATKLLYYRKKVQENYPSTAPEDCEKLSKEITNLDYINKLCDTFIAYQKVMSPHLRLGLNLNRFNQRLLVFTLTADLASNILDDVPFYLSQEGKLWPKDTLKLFEQDLAWYIDCLGKKSIQIVESFGFDEELLHSCISRTADETYEKMFDMSKNHNPRNDPKIQEEIRKDLLKFLNRPADSKL